MYSGKIAVSPGGGGIRKLYTKVEKFMIIARAPKLDPEARRGM
jgi:hypothetical protein